MKNTYSEMVSQLTKYLKRINGVKIVSYKSKPHPSFLEATGHIFYTYRNKRFMVSCPMHQGMDYSFAYVYGPISTTKKKDKLDLVHLFTIETSGPENKNAWSKRVFYPLTLDKVKQAVLSTYELHFHYSGLNRKKKNK